MMKLYGYNPDKILIGEIEVSEDPIEKGKFIFPANSTLLKPLAFKKGYDIKFDNDKWIYVEKINIKNEPEDMLT